MIPNPKNPKGDAVTQYSRVLAELDSQSICANTPQAKGRVERANLTLQDRLVKELRLQGINDSSHCQAPLGAIDGPTNPSQIGPNHQAKGTSALGRKGDISTWG